jgi:catechol 2,3-dioxygenase-like lactoylglutathione lyase family enzyme
LRTRDGTDPDRRISFAAVFGEFDHVGWIVRDLDAATAWAQDALGLDLLRSAALPRYAIEANFLGAGSGTLEIFTFTDAEILEARLEGKPRRLDHVAFRLQGLDALLASLRASGARFCTPDRREELAEPIEVGPNRQIWSVPESTGGLALQLNEPLAR